MTSSVGLKRMALLGLKWRRTILKRMYIAVVKSAKKRRVPLLRRWHLRISTFPQVSRLIIGTELDFTHGKKTLMAVLEKLTLVALLLCAMSGCVTKKAQLIEPKDAGSSDGPQHYTFKLNKEGTVIFVRYEFASEKSDLVSRVAAEANSIVVWQPGVSVLAETSWVEIAFVHDMPTTPAVKMDKTNSVVIYAALNHLLFQRIQCHAFRVSFGQIVSPPIRMAKVLEFVQKNRANIDKDILKRVSAKDGAPDPAFLRSFRVFSN